MLVSTDTQIRLVEYYSVSKIIAIDAFVLGLAILPLTPGFSEGLRYTRMLYEPGLFFILIGACLILGLLVLSTLPLLWRALRGLPAIEVEHGVIRVHGASGRSVHESQIIDIDPPKLGNVVIRIGGERPLTLPLFLYRDSSRVWQRLSPVLRKR